MQKMPRRKNVVNHIHEALPLIATNATENTDDEAESYKKVFPMDALQATSLTKYYQEKGGATNLILASLKPTIQSKSPSPRSSNASAARSAFNSSATAKLPNTIK